MTRYILEGEWTGYSARQRHVAHIEIIKGRRRVERLRGLHCIVYTDGTSLLLHVREAKRGETIVEKLGYSSLIRDAEAHGGSRVLVADLAKAEPAQ